MSYRHGKLTHAATPVGIGFNEAKDLDDPITSTHAATPVEIKFNEAQNLKVPRASPYASKTVGIKFKEAKNLFNVPRAFLKDQSWVTEETNSYTCNHSEEVAHVLIHFLFTGNYQILEKDKTNIAEGTSWAELRIAVRVLLALYDWNLDGLQVLVQSEIESLCKSIHIFDVVQLIDKELKGRAVEQEIWLKALLVDKLNTAFEKNSKEFEDLFLLDKLHNIDLIKFLAKNMFEIYQSLISKLRRIDIEARKIESQDTNSVSTMIFTPDSTSGDKYESRPKDKTSVFKPSCVYEKARGTIHTGSNNKNRSTSNSKDYVNDDGI